jgi:uncharacterized protein YvpB
MALNETEVIRVHKNFKKYMKELHEQSGIPITKISKRLAEERPIVAVIKIKKKVKQNGI